MATPRATVASDENMEKRYEHRRPLRIRVAVHDRQGHIGTFETRNATSEGMYIETGRWFPAAGEAIWIAVPGEPSDIEPKPLTAVVVHNGSDGVGVVLSQPLTETLAAAAPSREAPARSRAQGDPRPRVKVSSR